MIYDLILEAHHGDIPAAFALARSLAAILTHSVVVRGNGVSVEVRPGDTDDDCRRAYTRAIEMRASHQPRADPT